MINLARIDKFYIALIVTLVFLLVMVVFTLRTIFTSYMLAFETTDTQTQLKINTATLDEAYEFAFNKKVIPLRKI